MRRLAMLSAVVLALAGCGGGETAAPVPETVEGETPAATTEGDTSGTTTEGETSGTTTDGEDPTRTDNETAATQTQPRAEGNAEEGKAIFAANGCGSCHTLADAGSSGTIGPNLDESKPDLELALDRIANGKDQMPAFKDQLTGQQIADVATYVVQASGGGG